jgi:hypothetical protein
VGHPDVPPRMTDGAAPSRRQADPRVQPTAVPDLQPRRHGAHYHRHGSAEQQGAACAPTVVAADFDDGVVQEGRTPPPWIG